MRAVDGVEVLNSSIRFREEESLVCGRGGVAILSVRRVCAKQVSAQAVRNREGDLQQSCWERIRGELRAIGREASHGIDKRADGLLSSLGDLAEEDLPRSK